VSAGVGVTAGVNGAFFELRADKIARITTYYNLHAWLSQIGV
jgi:hypothetical protein